MDDDGRWTMMGWESGNGKWKMEMHRRKGGRGICFLRVGKLYILLLRRRRKIPVFSPIPCMHSFNHSLSLASEHPASSTHTKKHGISVAFSFLGIGHGRLEGRDGSDRHSFQRNCLALLARSVLTWKILLRLPR